MSHSGVHDGAMENNELRQRLPQQPSVPQQAQSAEAAKQTVLELNAAESGTEKLEKDRRTYGRTPDGTVFTVPQTHDMVSQLLSPTQPKNISDIVVLGILGLHILTLIILPRKVAIPVFAVVFLFWRACYNGGIGYLLNEQSHNNAMVEWAKRSRVFENPEKGTNPRPGLYKILKREMETKIPKDYKFENAPIEYNAWLTFRRVVDLVLMCDFTSYCLFAIACGGRPAGESIAMTMARWAAGIGLVLFNLWVKLDAHRVVKDYAWYWGDFFYLIDQELTFDGVFEMAPHPMYSVGYAGFYGISLMAASYKVLFISIIAHAAQFAFLAFVENPHIDKTYNPPPARTSVPDAPKNLEEPTSLGLDTSIDNLSPPLSPVQSKSEPPSTRDLLGIHNLDLHRVVDVAAVLLQLYLYTLALFTPSTFWYNAFFVLNAIVWRLWYSLGIGIILSRQSNEKSWTRHFIKHGESSGEAWRQWKGVYHISMSMCYISFVVAALKMYSIPPDWEVGMVLLRHVLGVAMIALQLWTVLSIYEELGEYGWFFGDFFFDNSAKLTYGGIYRFLNNPERVIGLAGVWGFAIITWSKAIFFLALLSHVLTLVFIQFVEKPHMEKRYGQSVRQQSGVSKTFTRSLPPKVRQWQGSMDRVFDETVDFIEGFVESARPKLATGVETIVKDTKSLFRKYPARLSITRLAPDLQGFEPKEYSIEFEGTPALDQGAIDKASGRESEIARSLFDEGKEFQPAALEYGAPIKVRWTAPLHHSKYDWVGLYMISDNPSKTVTTISSQGRWIATNRGAFDSTSRSDQGILISDKQNIKWEEDRGQASMIGEMEFSGDKLWWTGGVFELRYHHDGKHNVMAVSKPFEIRVGRFVASPSDLDSTETYKTAIENNLLRIIRNCFDRDPDIAPNTVDEGFGGLVERDGKFAKRVVFAVREMFGIEFSTEVVRADGNVRNLAWRIYNAKQVLAPYSMSSGSSSQTPSTPTKEKQ